MAFGCRSSPRPRSPAELRGTAIPVVAGTRWATAPAALPGAAGGPLPPPPGHGPGGGAHPGGGVPPPPWSEANVLGEVREAFRQRQRPDAPADMGTLVERIKAYPGRGRSEQRICLQYATSRSCTQGPRGCKFAHPVPGLLGHMLAGLPPG
ncbi:hypothetical protein PLESTF_001220400 [Pleodorina starrii]|nr:hypothetical protein PLESTF_001220400 [Pleodorina starrii]